MDGSSKHPGRTNASGLLSVSPARRRNMERGVDDLAQWIRDILSTGIIHIPDQLESVERIAERMVDAQLGSIAKRLRMGIGLVSGDSQWQEKWLGLTAQLNQFISLFRKIDQLPAPLVYDVWQFAGVFFKKKDVLAGKPVRDNWIVLGVDIRPEEQLLARKVWLFGQETRLWAMLLDYGMNTRALDPVPATGQLWDAVLTFYPSATGHRALVVHSATYRAWSGPPMGFDGWEAFQQYRFQRLMKNPLEETFPCMIRHAEPDLFSSEEWRMFDSSGRMMLFESKWGSPDQWISLSSNGPLAAFGEVEGQRFRVWSVYTQGRLIACNQ